MVACLSFKTIWVPTKAYLNSLLEFIGTLDFILILDYTGSLSVKFIYKES